MRLETVVIDGIPAFCSEGITIFTMDGLRQRAIRSLLWGWCIFVLQLGQEGQHLKPILILTPLVSALFGADNARQFFSHTPNFSVSFLLVYVCGVTLTWPKVWWLWVAALPSSFLFSLLVGSTPLIAFRVTLSLAVLPMILAIGELGKRRWPQVGVAAIWAVITLILYNAIIEFMPGAYANTLDPIDFVYGTLGSLTAYATLLVWAKTA